MTKYFYSPSTKGFYLDNIHKVIPEDAIEITAERHEELLKEQSEGKVISFENNAVKTVEYVKVISWEDIRRKRNSLLSESDWTQIPDTPLDDDTREAWRLYRQELRDITMKFKLPEKVVWPVAPSA